MEMLLVLQVRYGYMIARMPHRTQDVTIAMKRLKKTKKMVMEPMACFQLIVPMSSELAKTYPKREKKKPRDKMVRK